MKSRLATLLIGHAANRLRRRHPDWADAMVNESVAILSDGDRLRWSVGCAIASYRTPGVFDWVVYPAALIVGIALMAIYQWSADESLRTVAVLALIGLALGVLQPNRSLISGATTGLVVAAVNGFETLTGVRPAYETAAHSLLHDARWIVLIAPALFAAVIGGHVGVKLRSVLGAGS